MKLIITNMKKETAVEALSEYTRIVDKKVYADLKEIIEQCKQMHKEEIKSAYREGRSDQQSNETFYHRNSEQYYNETFGGEQC